MRILLSLTVLAVVLLGVAGLLATTGVDARQHYPTISTMGEEPLRYCSEPSLPIPDDDPEGTTSSQDIISTRAISDVNILISATHPWVGDLVFRLNHSSGYSVTLIDRPGHSEPESPGCSGNDINVILDDAGIESVEDACNPTSPAIRGVLSPTERLEPFVGQPLTGTWTLEISDHLTQNLGMLHQWCVIAQPIPTPTHTHLPLVNPPRPTCLPGSEMEPNNLKAETDSQLLFCWGNHIIGTLPPGGDNDLFRMKVTPQTPSLSTLRLTNIPAGSNYHLYLYDANLSMIADSTNPGSDDEEIVHTLAEGTYYLRVYLRQGGSNSPYTLSWN